MHSLVSLFTSLLSSPFAETSLSTYVRKVIRIPESVGSGILGFTIRNPAEGIQNPTNDWNPGSEWNPKSR